MKIGNTGHIILEDLQEVNEKIDNQIEQLEMFEKQVANNIKQSNYGNEIIDSIKSCKKQLINAKEEIKLVINNIK